MASPRSCLSADEIVRFVDGAAGDHDELDRHVDDCEACRRSVAAMVRAGRQAPVDATSTVSVAGLTSLAQRNAGVPVAESTGYTRATLRDEEIQTARTMIRMGRVVGLAAIAPLPLLGGSLAVQIVFATTVVIAIAVGLVLERQFRNPDRYSENAMLALASLVVLAGLAGMLYYGIFSAAQLFPVLTIYVFSRRERYSNTLVIYGMTAIGQVVLATIVIGGVVADPGLFEPVAPRAFLLVGHVLIQIGDLAAFMVGRHSRDATRAAIDNMQHAMVLAAKREVLLQEAREELERAIQIGGAGRYSDHTFGSYRLGNVLGRGGMGEVYEAFHVETNEPAAVKLLAPRELANPRSVERFVREVRAVSALRSRHVVRVLEASGERDPIPYLVMERLFGETLAQVLRGPALAPDQLVEMLAQVGTAIEEAWEHGIIHRDLKPHNVFRADQPGGRIWKVLDFGVAALSDHTGTLTQGHVIGTPAYMAPEQARGERVDHRADVYALAAIAYRWLTGRPVCAGGDLRASLYQVVHATPARPSALADLHPDVDAVIAIGLAKAPDDRWSRVAELRDALARAFEGQLDPRIRERAAELVTRHPWGSVRD